MKVETKRSTIVVDKNRKITLSENDKTTLSKEIEKVQKEEMYL